MRECYLNTMDPDGPIEVRFALFEVCKQGHTICVYTSDKRQSVRIHVSILYNLVADCP